MPEIVAIRSARVRWVSALCLILMVAPVLLACGDAPKATDVTLVAERETIGDTTTVRIVSGSVWGAPITAVEEMSIGALEGPDEVTFGFISAMMPDESGGVYIFDGTIPAMRYYDTDGRFVRKLAGKGAGPGEYQDVALGLEIRRDGRLMMRDPRNGRLNLYNPDGTYSDAWPVASGLFTSQATTMDTLDHIYLKILTGPIVENQVWPIGLLHLDSEGAIVDTILSPPIDGEPKGAGNGRFLPQKFWTLSRYGQTIVGVSDEYRLEIRNPDGTVTRVEKDWTAVPVGPEEKSEWQAMLDWQEERQGQSMSSGMAPIPDEKPVYQGIFAGLDGTIWIRLHAPAEKRESTVEAGPDGPPAITWVEPRVYDVFEADGTYLGQVRPPPRTTIYVFSRTESWGVRRGELDEQYAVRLRIENPSELLETAPDR